jgi:hypothetical protein
VEAVVEGEVGDGRLLRTSALYLGENYGSARLVLDGGGSMLRHKIWQTVGDAPNLFFMKIYLKKINDHYARLKLFFCLFVNFRSAFIRTAIFRRGIT